MQSTRLFVLISCLFCTALTELHAQPFPSKLIRIITSEAGAGADLFSRYIAQGIAGPLGQPVIVDNRGGNFVIQARELMAAPPDGHTLIFGTATMWVQALFEKVPYDPVADFAPVAMAARAPNVLVIHPSLPVKNVAELIALAKAKPGLLNYASGISGSSVHIAGELFKAMAGVNIVRIPYKGMGPALVSIMGGETELMFSSAVGVPPLIKAGRLKALAVTSVERFPLMPGLPTVAQTVPGYESGLVLGLMAPGKTPTAVIRRLNEEVVRVLKTPAARERFLAEGVEVVGSTPEEYFAARKADMERVEKVIVTSGLRNTN